MRNLHTRLQRIEQQIRPNPSSALKAEADAALSAALDSVYGVGPHPTPEQEAEAARLWQHWDELAARVDPDGHARYRRDLEAVYGEGIG